MNRRDFIANGCAACLGATALSGLLAACGSVRNIAGTAGKDGITVSADAFKTTKNGSTTYSTYIIVRNDILQYPLYVYRFNETMYTALWMQCTHQGAELQASGDYLQCPAHGSEFDRKGKVTNGPADKDLRSFPVTVNNNELFIDLRKS